MRLCIATSSYPSQGENSFVGVFAQDFAKELVRQGNEVSIFTQDTRIPRPADDGINVITFRWPDSGTPVSSLRPYHPIDLWKILLLLRRGTKELARHCLHAKVDLVLALWALPAGHWGMGLRRRFGVPYAVWSLGSDIWIYGRLPISRLWVRKILRESDYCFADGFSLLNEISGLSGRPCSFLPTTRMLPKDGLPKIPLDRNTIHYLFVGRYHPNKGPDLLLEAVRRIDPEILSGLEFHFFGSGPLENDLRRKVLDYGLKDHVTIEGPVDQYTVAALLQQCQSLIIPSRIESIPVILSDALQLNCDLIVTDAGDMGTLVRSHRAGIVVDKESPDELKEAIVDRLKREKDAFREGRQKLYTLFDLEKSVDTFLKTIEYPGSPVTVEND